MEASAALHDALSAAGLAPAAPYAVCMAYRIRFYMEMNAREAMHVLELRTAPQGHPAYRRVCQAMHRLIAEQAGHRGLAAAMRFVDHSAVELERLEAGAAHRRPSARAIGGRARPTASDPLGSLAVRPERTGAQRPRRPR